MFKLIKKNTEKIKENGIDIDDNSPDPQKKDNSSLNDVGFRREEPEKFPQPIGLPRMRTVKGGKKFFTTPQIFFKKKLGFLREPGDPLTRSIT